MQGFDFNIASGFGDDAITVKIKDGCRWPYLLMDRNHFQADTTRPLEEYLRLVSKKSDRWSPRRCDNEKKCTDGWTPDEIGRANKKKTVSSDFLSLFFMFK